MDLRLSLGIPQAHTNTTIAPMPTEDQQYHDQTVVLALSAKSAIRVFDAENNQGERKNKGKQPVIEDGECYLDKRPIMQRRRSVLPLFPAHLETGNVDSEECTQGVQIVHKKKMPIIKEDEKSLSSPCLQNDLPKWWSADQESSRGKRATKRPMLSKANTVILEERFKERQMITQEKNHLTGKISIEPEQVEVRSQNKDMSKLKQAEMDCEYLRQRLNVEIQENRVLRSQLMTMAQLQGPAAAQPFYAYQPSTSLAAAASMPNLRDHLHSYAPPSANSGASSQPPMTTWFTNPPFRPFPPVHMELRGHPSAREPLDQE